MRVTFVNRFYWPSEPATAQLLTDLAEALAADGAAVRVITGYTAPQLSARETRHGVEIVRVGPQMRPTQNLARRALDFVAFRAAVARTLRDSLQPGELLVALTDPPLIGVTAWRAARARGARLVHWAHDIYPEIFDAVSGSLLSRASRRLFTPARNAAWREAAACVALGEDMAAFIRAAGVDAARVRVIPNWAPQGLGPAAPEETAALRQRWGIDATDFVVGYSGNLGRVHDLDGLLDVAATLRADANIVFLFVGGGAAFARLQAEAQARRLANVRFLPPQPRRDLSATLGVPDVHIISVREGLEQLVFPSKLHGVAAAGRPMLVLAPPQAEIARLVAAEGLGAAFRPSESAAIAGYLRALAAQPERRATLAAAARRYDAASGGWPRARARWTELLRGLDASP